MIKRIHGDGLFQLVQSLKPHWAGGASLLCTAAFFALYLTVFRPGYLVNDDITMISLVSGYLGGKPVPFMVYSNVIWGFLLMPLYSIHSNLNWEIWLFVLVNFLSVWALVYIASSRPLHIIYKLAGVLAVLTCDGFLLINITYTEIAAMAALAGSCLILMTAYSPAPFKRALWVCGGLLILISSLLRMDAMYLVLLTILPPALLLHRVMDWRRLVPALAFTSLMVAGCYAFNKVYVGLHPDWNSYYAYNGVRSMIFDTPRAHIENIEEALPDVGWSGNDYTLFINLFFPDQKVFSSSNLQYLVDHVSDRESSLNNAFLAYFRFHHIFNARDAFPYFLVIAATWFLALMHPPLRKSIPALSVLAAGALLLVLYLVWKRNVPLHVWYSFLATIGIFGLCILGWNANKAELETPTGQKILAWAIPSVLFVATSVALILVLYWASLTTKENIAKQSAYQQMLSDLDSLQAEGRIVPNALIISPAVGIPIEWSNPLFVSWPNVQYFQMEWLTFSPVYDDVLREHGVQSLPAGFYEKNNIYLMTKKSLIPSVIQSIKEHEGVAVKAESIYSPTDSAVILYRLVQKN
jgi:hypothetical protein